MRKTNLTIQVAFCVFMMALAVPAGDGATIHVPADFNSIQAAIDTANDYDEIEVAAGTYNEAINFNGKAVRLYSIGGPEVTTIDANGAFHVVQCVNGEDANTVLEGFTITGGNANGPDPNDKCGGGMLNFLSSPTVTNCIFTGNVANYGGGMYCDSSSPTVTNCIFSSNNSGNGGGMNNVGNSSPTVTNCTFTGNVGSGGGGMSNYNSSPTVTGCTFRVNISGSRGGGMFNDASSPTVTDCNFSDNSADRGGSGILNCNNSSPTVTNCTFTRNPVDYGGGMGNVSSSPTVTNCNFSNNTARILGGGMYNQSSSPSMTNCTFSDNFAYYNGGGMFNDDNSNPTLTNCTFSDNFTYYNGSGICNKNSSPTVTNCIFWKDATDEIFNYSSTPTVTYSDVEGGWPGEGNIDVDPCFVDAAAGNLRLDYDSPCIDAGDTTAVPTGIFVDADMNSRALDNPVSPDTGMSLIGATVDIGAYEFNPCTIAGDINCDGVVDFRDVAILCNNWLAGTEPEL